MPGLAIALQFAGAPAPSEVVDAVQHIEVESSVDLASAFRMRLGIGESLIGDWTILQTDYFRPLVPITIRVSNALGIPEALIVGYTSNQTVHWASEPSRSVLEVTGSGRARATPRPIGRPA